MKKSTEYRKVRHFISSAATLFALLTAFVIFPGCTSGGDQDAMDRILIRVGESTVTVPEFHEALQSGISSPSILYGDREALRSARYRTLNRLTEELIIMERARELKIQVSDEELALTVNDFKKDFPDDTFEQTLIENGISYLAWEKGMKRRLLMEKVVRTDVRKDFFPVPLSFDEAAKTRLNEDFQVQFPLEEEDTAEIETGNIEALIDGKLSENEGETDGEIQNPDVPENEPEEAPAPAMPENGAESEYEQWLNRLKNQYTIEINWELWEEIEQEDTGGYAPGTEDSA